MDYRATLQLMKKVIRDRTKCYLEHAYFRYAHSDILYYTI